MSENNKLFWWPERPDYVLGRTENEAGIRFELYNPNIKTTLNNNTSLSAELTNPNIQGKIRAQTSTDEKVTNPNVQGRTENNSTLTAEVYNPNVQAKIEGTSAAAGDANNPNVEGSLEGKASVVDNLRNPNFFAGEFNHSTELEGDIKNPNVKGLLNNNGRIREDLYSPNTTADFLLQTNYDNEEELVAGVEVRTLHDERTHDFVEFYGELIEVGAKEIAYVGFEYRLYDREFDLSAKPPIQTELIEITEPGEFEVKLTDIEADANYYFCAIAIVFEDEEQQEEIYNQYKGDIRRSFPTDFTVGGGRYENYIDARDLEVAEELEVRGRSRLEEKRETLVASVEYQPGGPYEFLHDFDVGDYAVLMVPPNYQKTVRITEIQEEYTEDGKYINIRFGQQTRDILETIKQHRREVDAELRH